MSLCKKKIAWQPIFIFRSGNEKRSDTWLLTVEPDRGFFVSLSTQQLPYYKLLIVLICHDWRWETGWVGFENYILVWGTYLQSSIKYNSLITTEWEKCKLLSSYMKWRNYIQILKLKKKNKKTQTKKKTTATNYIF